MNNMTMAYEIRTIYFLIGCVVALMAAKDFGLI